MKVYIDSYGCTFNKADGQIMAGVLNENDIVEFEEEVRNGKLSATTIAVVQRDEESARRFQERRAERRRDIEDRKQRDDKSARRGFAFWKK